MKMSPTLGRYLGLIYATNLVSMVGILWSIIYMFDTLELMRRAGTKHVPLGVVLKMGLLQMPSTGLAIFSFAILLSAIYTFWRLNRRHELVVVRSAGFSVWQFLSPIVGVAVITGFFIITVANPFSAVMLSRFKTLEAKYLTHRRSEIALFDEGLWLRQWQDDDSYIILHAGNVRMPDWELRGIMALYFDKNDTFIKRIDAQAATLSDKEWRFEKAVTNAPNAAVKKQEILTLPTDLTQREIEESFAAPDTMSVWRLPAFIATVESTGFDATRLKIHFQSLLAQPFLYAAMILLAAAVALRPPRFRSTLTLVVMGVGVGFTAFFVSSFLQALGSSHQIPVFLAAWSPSVVMLLLGVAAMLGLEDG
ncbi:MAG TPA: LPS export ABC transporter permease LptG [Patescibacteria group bacterium]|nr:LPS export ABC transporter permease LptG [Patescibacteria group bacterium]